MKKIITFLFILFLFTSNICFSQSGWYKIFDYCSTGISKIIQSDANTYFAFSSSDVFLKSTDGGNTWLHYKGFDSTYLFVDGVFVNPNSGWIVGYSSNIIYGQVFKTTDGGLNWNKIFLPTTTILNTVVFFVNQQTGWLGSSVSGSARLYKTTNGGQNWSYQDFPQLYYIHNIKFFNENSGWICGSSANNFLLAKTTNGGQNWTSKPIFNIPYPNPMYTSLFALSMNECWALVRSYSYPNAYTLFYKTANGGDNWELKYTYIYSNQLNSRYFGDLHFVNSFTGYANGSFNFLLRTTNGGAEWDTVKTTNYFTISTQLHTGDNKFFIGGGYADQAFGHSYQYPYNLILKTTNTGNNWSIKSHNWSYIFHDVFFKDLNNGVVISDSTIYKTTNNGTNWLRVFNDKSVALKNISFLDENTGCIGCSSGKILRTTNFGNNWTIIQSLVNTSLIICKLNSASFIACSDSGRILKSTNFGLNWQMEQPPSSILYNYCTIYFVNQNTGWIFGSKYIQIYPPYGYYKYVIQKTTNSGANWVIQDSSDFDNTIAKLRFLNEQTGWIIYPYNKAYYNQTSVRYTTNGGTTWSVYNTNFIDHVRDVIMINEQIGWIYGGPDQNRANIFKTTNGGNNWFLQLDDHNRDIYGMFVKDSAHSWIVGDLNGILYSSNGGGNPIGIINTGNELPQSFSLSQNYPNPFNPVTRIKFSLPNPSKGGIWKNVRLVIYDILGREVATLIPPLGGGQEGLKPGSYEVTWDGSRYASGVYFYRLITDEYVVTKKMVLIK